MSICLRTRERPKGGAVDGAETPRWWEIGGNLYMTSELRGISYRGGSTARAKGRVEPKESVLGKGFLVYLFSLIGCR